MGPGVCSHDCAQQEENSKPAACNTQATSKCGDKFLLFPALGFPRTNPPVSVSPVHVCNRSTEKKSTLCHGASMISDSERSIVGGTKPTANKIL